jgi:hypothetical protein
MLVFVHIREIENLPELDGNLRATRPIPRGGFHESLSVQEKHAGLKLN